MPVRPAIIPVLRYSDALAAIDFLERAFGFSRQAVYLDPSDASRVAHAQLVRQDCMIMLSTAMPTPFAVATRMQTPSDLGGVTQSIYVTLDNVDEHASQARGAGADIVMPPEDQAHGGRSYSAVDCEGNAWTFGSYDPFEA